MTTPTFITGFEGWPDTPTSNGGGLLSSVSGTPSIDVGWFNTGSRSLNFNPSGVTEYIRLYIPTAGDRIGVGRLYVKFNSLPSGGGCRIVDFDQPTGSAIIGVDINGKWFAQIAGGSVITDSSGPVVGEVYRIDWIARGNGNPNTLDWKIDGADKVQASTAISAQDFVGFFIGVTSAATVNYNIDDIVISKTEADYPIGPGGTELLLPASDGTHNSGTNIMEDNSGVDIGITTAYNKLNSVPPDSTTYIRQASSGTGNYIEVLFGNLLSTLSGIIGSVARLAYTSATTSSNQGGSIISVNNFSSQTVLHGGPGSPSDYSDGSISNLFYKSTIIPDAIDETTINNIKARLGYSGDVSPNPYWIDMSIEVAYITNEETDISLDLITYTSNINSIIVLESELILLDLVTYSININSISILENELILLDLITYVLVINDVSTIESELILLDLITYTSIINNVNVLENELTHLDLVWYSLIIYDIMVVEQEIVFLDLVSFLTIINDVSLLDNSDIGLDLIIYTTIINNINVIESEPILLDLALYLTVIYDVFLGESDSIILDIVQFNYSFYDIYLVEIYITPLSRCYLIEEESRICLIEAEERIIKVSNEERQILIHQGE